MTRRGLAAFWMLTLVAAGCTPLFPERPPRAALHDFGPAPRADAARAMVSVDEAEWLQDDRMRYRLLYADPTQVRFYTLDRWVAPPPMLLAQRLGSVGGEGYRLRLEVEEFEQIFDRPGQAHAVLSFRLSARAPTADRPVTELFRFSRPTPTADAAGAAAAFAELADEAAKRVRVWLLQIPHAPDSGGR